MFCPRVEIAHSCPYFFSNLNNNSENSYKYIANYFRQRPKCRRYLFNSFNCSTTKFINKVADLTSEDYERRYDSDDCRSQENPGSGCNKSRQCLSSQKSDDTSQNRE